MSAPYIITEEYWANTQLSIVRHHGQIRFQGEVYMIVNKDGKNIFQCSTEAHREGREKAIPPGEPCDLCRIDLIPAYRKLGRDRMVALIKEGKTDKEIKYIAKTERNESPRL